MNWGWIPLGERPTLADSHGVSPSGEDTQTPGAGQELMSEALRVKPQTAALPNCTQVLPKRNLTGGTRITAARMAVLIGKLQHGHHAQRTRWDPPSLRPPPRCRPA